jgi:hypothetical protein
MVRIANARNAADRWENVGVCSGVEPRGGALPGDKTSGMRQHF